MRRIETLLIGILSFNDGLPLLAGRRPGSWSKTQKSPKLLGSIRNWASFIPLDLTFLDENGHPVTSRDLIHAPTILALVYLHCPNVCSLLLQNTADVLIECQPTG